MDDMLRPLKNQLLELKLKHLAAQLDDFMLTASCSDKPYAELLQDFLAVEIRQRRSVSMDKRLRMANLPTFDVCAAFQRQRATGFACPGTAGYNCRWW